MSLRKIATKFGLLSESKTWVAPPRPFDELYTYLLSGKDFRCIVFDEGSYHGESIDRFQNQVPTCIIHSFEPDSKNFRLLEKKYRNDPDIFLNNCGNGDEEGTLTFHCFIESDVSSFVEIDKDQR